VIVAVPAKPIQAAMLGLIFQQQSIQGWPSGTSIDSEDTLRFSEINGALPMIENRRLPITMQAQRDIDGEVRCGWREHKGYFCAGRLALSSTLSCFRVGAHASILALASLRLISPAMTFPMTSSISSPDLLRRFKNSSRSSSIVNSFLQLPFVSP
jgi:hypothetical protein